jgi:hypothetical protein
MAMNVVRMRGMIKSHGHLLLEGDETKSELMEALTNLRHHTWERCQRPWLGTTSIEALLPDIAEIYERQTRAGKPTQRLDLRTKQL